jgi:hypothetical protein
MLRAFVNYKQDNWDECLPAAEFTYNSSVQASTGYSPFQLDCGQDPITPDSLLIRNLEPSNVATTEDFLNNWQNMMAQAKESLLKAQERQAKHADHKRHAEEFQVGDQVMLSTAHLSPPTEKQRPLKKLQPKFIGPYKIVQKISTLAYKLDLPHDMKIHPVFHISLLKLHKPSPPEFQERVQAPPPPVYFKNQDEPEYEVQEIQDKRTRRGKTEYLVLWKGFNQHDATWEPIENLTHCKALVRAYEEQQ